MPSRHPFFVGRRMAEQDRNISELDLIKQSFGPLADLPSWNARRIHGSIFHMEFGDPHLKVREPTARRKHRSVFVCGQWTLCIYLCDWIIRDDQKLLAHSESDNIEIEKAIAFLEGQKIIDVAKHIQKSKWRFTFDLGGRLTTSPNEEYDETDDQWTLHEPDGWFLVTDQLGNIKRVPGDSPA
jgi:hypothetical protein